MANGVSITVKQTGRIRGPNLSDPQLRRIGEEMVEAQKQRWAKAVDAQGQPAKKLSVKYAIIKQAYRHQKPVRDMLMTGGTVANFTLRKAANGAIRAENTTRLARAKALRANSYDQMIGFAVSDIKVVFNETQAQYGQYVRTAWVPMSGTNRRPADLNG
jgi:ABC-type xylose transport system substrate-binding protein